MKEVTIEITQYCEENCWFCSSQSSAEGKHLDFETIKIFLENNSDAERINISGGEPLAHPDFYKILKYCEWKCSNVWVYTNALKSILYNSHVLKEIRVEANVCLTPGEAVYIPQKVQKVHLLKLTGSKEEIGRVPQMSLSGCDCSKCSHALLQADGKIVKSPCTKDYSIITRV